MISLHQSGELVYHEIPSLISLKNHPQDLLANHHHDHVHVQTPNLVARKSHHSSSKPNLASTTKHFKSENMLRKLVHREIERTRRKDQARLYASLGGLLPSELTKGKRSVSDRIDQAVSYIKQMQERVNDLTIKRDELKKIADATTSVEESLMNAVPNTVSISSSNGRSVEIQINSCLIEDGFCLSGVLKALVEEGLHIINSTSKKINKRLLNCIQSEANATTLADPSMLLQRLTAIANYNHLGKISIN